MASTSTSGRGEQERDPFLVLGPPNKKIASPLTAKQFEVFINHRGPDVKTTLARQLYDSLQQAGIRAYLDSEETEQGDSISSTIKNAISSAKVHIAILSPRYAESAWCLAELELMFQTKARIIPLFYHVRPSDFRYIKNGVAEAFSEHEKKGRYSDHDIQQWKECLQHVSGIKGYELNGQNENDKSLWNSILEKIRKLVYAFIGIPLSSTGSDQSKLCNDVVSAVVKEKRKRKIPFQVAKYEVGLDEIVKDFNSHCQRSGQMRDTIIGIFGMGGSGKTTLAKYLFNHKQSEFSGSTILFDVREKHVKGELTSLQSELLEDLFGSKKGKNSNKEKGIADIRDNLQRSRESRFLIVIDDADHRDQIDALLPIDALNPSSLVIVTTRDERVLIQARVRIRYKMKEMKREHSRKLFCWHAFQRPSCKREFKNLVGSFVEACGGLPLALQVIGAHVCGSNKDYWKSVLDDVKARLHRDIKDKLKISYDALEEDQKQIFMDIACFFIGEDVKRAISIWKASGWRAEHALQTLKDKCLVQLQINYDENDIVCYCEPTFELIMHDHLRDLGREMADNEMSHPRRLWRPKDLIGMDKIKGFQDSLTRSEGRWSGEVKVTHDFGSTIYMTYFLESSKTSTDLQWLQLGHYSHLDDDPLIPEWISLQNLHTLRLTDVSVHTLLWERDDQVPLKLKELYCFIGVDQSSDILNELGRSIGMLKHLESLQLKSVGQYSVRTLECWNCLLKYVRELANLQNLELTGFRVTGEFDLSNRGETTDGRFHMSSIEAIRICGTVGITKVSISGQLCPTLKSLKLFSMTDLIEVDLTGVTTLECLVLVECGELGKVLCNDLPELEMFRLKLCGTIRELPNFGRVSCLKRIYISRCKKLEDISAIEGLKGLERIWIAFCPELKSIKAIEQLKGLKRIWIEGHSCRA